MKTGKKKDGKEIEERLKRMTHEERKAMIEAMSNDPRAAPLIQKVLEIAFPMAQKHVRQEGYEQGRLSVMILGYYFLRHELKIPYKELDKHLKFTAFERDAFTAADVWMGK